MMRQMTPAIPKVAAGVSGVRLAKGAVASAVPRSTVVFARQVYVKMAFAS